MKRAEFIKKSTFGCLGIVLGTSMLGGCAGANVLRLPLLDGKIVVPKSSFTVEKKGKIKQLRQVVLKNEQLEYPVVLYRNSDDSYKAMLLRCTHQGTQLNVHGDLIACPAHGSEFNNQGGIIQGPAKEQLKEFRTTLTSNNIIISIS